MGGLVAVGLIDETGSLRTVAGHTNTLPGTIKNARFVDGDLSAFVAWLDRYEARDLPFDMDDEAFGRTDHVPSEYGYVLVDAKERTILSAQDYTSLLRISGPRVTTDDEARIVTGRITWDDGDEVSVVPAGPYATAAEFAADPENDPRKGVPTFGEFFDELRAIVPDWRPEVGQGWADMFEAAHAKLSVERAQDLLARFKQVDDLEESDVPSFYVFEAGFKDWSVFDGSRTADDIETVRDYLADRGYLSTEAAAAWDAYLAPLKAPDEEVMETTGLPSP